MYKRILVFFVLLGSFSCWSQNDRISQIEQSLEVLAVDHAGLDETIDISISQVSITEFLRTIGINHKLNLSVSDDLDQKLITNFADARVADVLVFLCKEYFLDIQTVGGILVIKKYVAPVQVNQYVQRIPEVKYDLQTDFLSLDLKQDTLELVAREITRITMKNVILSPDLENKKVSGFIQNRPFDDAISKMCFANGLEVEQDGNFYMIRSAPKESFAANSKAEVEAKSKRKSSGEISIEVKDDKVAIRCEDVEIADLVHDVSNTMLKNYFLYSEPEGKISLFVENASYEEFLSYLFHSIDYSFTLQNGVYLIGSAKNDALVTTELIQLNYRTIENVFGSFGDQNSSRAGGSSSSTSGGINGSVSNRRGSSGQNPFEATGMKIQPFPELNSFIVTGTYPDVKMFKDFIFQIDQVVPVVMIEVLIVDVNKSRTMKAGIKAGLGKNAGATQGSITGDDSSAGINLDIGTQTINNLIQSFNGLGVMNLGAVSPDFYLAIQALETDGILKTRSTPKLATLNSYTASLSIGQQEYYLETSTTLSPSATNTVVTEQQRWTPVDADLNIEITPVVSGAEQVTLEISVTQSNFTTRSGENAPFGTVNREFQSSLRVKNGEMILLGGLEDKSVSATGEGVPLLSRIPVLKWLFGSRSRSKDESKLTIFIRPTIMY